MGGAYLLGWELMASVDGWMDGFGSHLSVGWSGLGAAHGEHLAALLIGAVISGPHAAQWACGEGNRCTATCLEGVT